MKIVFTILCTLLAAYCLFVRARAKRSGGFRFGLVWILVIVATWTGSWIVVGVVVVVAVAPLLRRLVGVGGGRETVIQLGNELQANSYRDRERAIRRCAELATNEAWNALLIRLAALGDGEDAQRESREIFEAIITGWQPDFLLEHWTEIPPRARIEFLDTFLGDSRLRRVQKLATARHGMNDEVEAVARAAWKSYAFAVTRAHETKAPDFDTRDWIAQTAQDPHPLLQKLRAGLQASLATQVQTKGMPALVAQYRSEAFKHALPTAVELSLSEALELRADDGRERRLAPGKHAGTLSGTFDNAQDAVHEGWRLRFEWKDEAGVAWRREAVWDAQELFTKVLGAAYDSRRTWFDDASEEMRRALGTGAFVGPIVTYGVEWGDLAPRVGDQVLRPADSQLLLSLLATLSTQDAGTQLAFLFYEMEDAEDEGEELPPFVTIVELEDLLREGA